jgi:hypothetical protein
MTSVSTRSPPTSATKVATGSTLANTRSAAVSVVSDAGAPAVASNAKQADNESSRSLGMVRISSGDLT